MKIPNQHIGIGILFFHLIGAFGTFWHMTRETTLAMTPVNLLLSSILIFVCHEKITTRWTITVVILAIIGYLVEVAGVATGQIFGKYQYGPVLGYAIWDVPLAMALNWFLLLYIFGQLVAPLKLPLALKAMLAGFGMVLLDVIIEPVAIELNYWRWTNVSVPFQNYVAWFVIGSILQVFFLKANGPIRNAFAFYLLASQLLYFLSILLFL
ncbi:MAG: carotenoid biosynthesis protein [Cytophagales bacterium]|nr:carotenoid biosynthesis protein [Cytophagales bacterium]